MHELRPSALIGESVQKAIKMLRGFGAALCCQSRRLVKDEGARILIDHHLANETRFILGQRLSFWFGPCTSGWRGLEWRNADLLASLDPIARHGFPAIEPQLAR